MCPCSGSLYVARSGGGGGVPSPAPDMKRQALVDDLSLRLAHGDLPARIQAARDVRRLARASSKSRAAFAVDSVVNPLLSMLVAPQAEAREVALLAVLNISAKNERNKINIVMFGAVPPLVELLKSESSRLRELAAAAIMTLSSSDRNKSIIISSGAPKLLVRILISGSIQGKVDTVTALYNLSTCKEAHEPCVYSECAFTLLTLLKDNKKYSKFAEKATALLEKLSDSEEGRIAISESDGGILTLVETVEDGSVLSVEYAASTLLALCRSCREKYRRHILNEGAIPGLLLLTVYGTERAKKIACELLDLLRDDAKPNRVTPEALKTIAFNIAARVDGQEKASQTAGILLKDMARWNMEMRINQLTDELYSVLVELPANKNVCILGIFLKRAVYMLGMSIISAPSEIISECDIHIYVRCLVHDFRWYMLSLKGYLIQLAASCFSYMQDSVLKSRICMVIRVHINLLKNKEWKKDHQKIADVLVHQMNRPCGRPTASLKNLCSQEKFFISDKL